MGPGGEAPRLSRGVWGAARPPKGGFSFQGSGGGLEPDMLGDWGAVLFYYGLLIFEFLGPGICGAKSIGGRGGV